LSAMEATCAVESLSIISKKMLFLRSKQG